MNWQARATSVSPLMGLAQPGGWGGEAQILEKIFSTVPHRAGYAVEFGQRSMGSGTVAELVARHGWGALYMDEAVTKPQTKPSGQNETITLASERVLPSNITQLFDKYAVPHDLDCLVIDIDGLDYWVWQALDSRYEPSLVVVEFNAHLGMAIEASITQDESWSYKCSKDYGASFAALCSLAARKGYRLIHVHGPWNLYFLKEGIPFPAELSVSQPLSESEYATLTDTLSFYDVLCGKGKRPSWFTAPSPDVTRAPWQIIAQQTATKLVDLEGITLEVLSDKHDGNWYLQRKTFEEKQSLLYHFIRDEGFTNFIDIGANYGFISIVARQAIAGLNIMAVEADPRLAPLITANFRRNGLVPPTVLNAIASKEQNINSRFSLNPASTLDNRVAMPGWGQVCVPTITIDALLQREDLSGRTFFKVDTQGFELNVLAGMEGYLARRTDWVLKMEFAPNWLCSQGTDPLALLDYLQSRYEFAEFAERIPFGTPGMDALFIHAVDSNSHGEFLEHVVSLNKGGLGWVDLIVRPRCPPTINTSTL